LVEETYDVKFDESNGSQGAHENLDDVGDETLREAIKNIPIGDIKPKDDEDEVQVVDPTSSSNVTQEDDNDGRIENEDNHVFHDQMVAQAQDVDDPQPHPQVVDRRNLPLLQAYPQDLIIGSSSKCVITHSKKTYFIY
jgi:hypothetical protein